MPKTMIKCDNCGYISTEHSCGHHGKPIHFIDMFSQSEVDGIVMDLMIKNIKDNNTYFEQLRKELKDMENKIMNDFDLNMAERKGAFIAICELQFIVDKFSQSSPDGINRTDIVPPRSESKPVTQRSGRDAFVTRESNGHAINLGLDAKKVKK